MDDVTPSRPSGSALSTSPFKNVHIELRVSVGKARPTVSDLLALESGAVLRLDSTISDPVEIYAGDRLIALGELEELDGNETGQLAVRLIEVGPVDEPL